MRPKLVACIDGANKNVLWLKEKHISVSNKMYRRGMNCTEKNIFKGINVQKNIWCSIPTVMEGGQRTTEFGCVDLKFSEIVEAAKFGDVPWCTMVYHARFRFWQRSC